MTDSKTVNGAPGGQTASRVAPGSGVTEARGLWLYAVGRAVPEARLRSVTGVGGRTVRAIGDGELTAVAEDVDLSTFGEDALRRNLENMDWLESTARAHHTVIDVVADNAPVVPMRLATVYSSDAGVRAMLTGRSAELRAVLDRLTGRSEWGVKAFSLAAAESDAGDSGDPARAASSSASGSQAAGPVSRERGAGAAYLRRRRDQISAHQDSRRAVLAGAQRLHDTLSGLATAARLHQPQAPQLAGTKDVMVLNAAYLLDGEQAAAVKEAVADLAGQFPALRIELTGPWPPYSFAELDETPI